MTNLPDAVELADELAEIARAATDSATGVRLMELVTRLLECAGLPPDEAGEAALPASWRFEAAQQPA